MIWCRRQRGWVGVTSGLQAMLAGKRTYVRLHPPVPIELLQTRMSVEETAVPTAHVSVTDHPTLADANRSQILETIHETAFIDPVGQGPVLSRHDFVVAF